MPYETEENLRMPRTYAESDDNFYRCSCGWFNFNITKRGSVFCTGCQRVQLLAGDTAEDRLQSSGNDADDHDDVHVRMEAERTDPTTTSPIRYDSDHDVELAYRRDEQQRFAIYVLGYVEGCAHTDDGTAVPTGTLYYALIELLGKYASGDRNR